MVPPGARERAWNRRYTALFRFVAEQGRFPKQLGGPVERGLERWLYTQRIKLSSAELDHEREDLLDLLGE
ncbi:helicase associated domain-containing protein [Arthrobacter sp. H20]|uniref:helicase associated domain-containing protein n=1 Tax=Arthrobacter sp. H20 TaxID=1267981 RepID=UPI00047B6192|nr:helicase associated domain-containing protein [Arthrobacter sp. H20]